MTTADESDNWRRKKQPFEEKPSKFWDSTSKIHSDRSSAYSSSTWKSSYNDSNRLERQQNNNRGRKRPSESPMEDSAPYLSRMEEHQKAKAQGATNDWINFSKNAEITPMPERGNTRDRQLERSKSSWRIYAKEHSQYDIPPNNTRRYVHPEDRCKSDRKSMYNPFISPESVEAGLKDGTLLQGEMRLSKNRQDAYVKCDDIECDIYIGSQRNKNRALQNDLVAVKLLDVDTEWEQKKEREAENAEKRKMMNKNIGIEFEEDSLDEESDDEENKPKYCGEVVAIIERPKNTTYTGTIMLAKPKDNAEVNNDDNERQFPRIVWFKPVDKKVPLMALFGNEIPKDIIEREEYYKTHLFSAEVRQWLITALTPAARIIKEIGPIGSLVAEKEAVVADNSIIDADFSAVALSGLPELPWSIPAAEYKKRLDLRSESVFSIDPLTAKDLDDALHVRPLEDGFFEIGVHISDVSYFLKEGSPLDSEAKNRGTSTYLCDRVIPMLPSVLCEQLCSLNPGVDKLAFSVLWIMDKDGNILKTWHGKTVIRSCAKLAYEHAQEVIEGRVLPEDVRLYGDQSIEGLSSDINVLYKMSLKMRQRRKDGGSLSLHSVKLIFDLDQNGEPKSFSQAKSKEANKLIEEFMLCANISVAEKIKTAFPSEALLRRHEKPVERRLDSFIKLTEVLGLDFDGSSAGSLQKSFNDVEDPDVKSILLVLCIRVMQRANYFCAGTLSNEKQIHYALNEPIYTHFTSPIRRYPDVIVHRMLQAALKNKPCQYSRRNIQKLANDCNIKKKGAKAAQEADTRLYLANYIHKQEQTVGSVYKKGIIIMTGKSSFEVYIPEYGLERRIYKEGLPVKKFDFDKHTLKLKIFWKKDIPVTMRNEEKIYSRMRAKDDDQSDKDENEDEYGDDMEKLLSDGLDHMKLSNGSKKIKSASELIPPVMINEAECTQCIQMFSLIDVRLQVNMEVSPPFINIYPINPFAEKEN